MKGSEQQFDSARILGCFSESDEFRLQRRHALGLEEEVAQVLVAATATEQRFQVTVDGLDYAHWYLGPAVVDDAFEVIDEQVGQFLKRRQALPAQLIDPAPQVVHHRAFPRSTHFPQQTTPPQAESTMSSPTRLNSASGSNK